MGFLSWSSLFPSQGGQSLVPSVSFWDSLTLLNLSPSTHGAATSVSGSFSSATARSAVPALPPTPWDRLLHLGGGVFPWQLSPRGHGRSDESPGRSFVPMPLGGRWRERLRTRGGTDGRRAPLGSPGVSSRECPWL